MVFPSGSADISILDEAAGNKRSFFPLMFRGVKTLTHDLRIALEGASAAVYWEDYMSTAAAHPVPLGTPTTTKPFPIPTSYFSVALGTSALGLSWRYGATAHLVPSWVGESILALASATWLALIAAFAVKLITRRDALQNELRDLVMCCFLALVPVTTIEVGISAYPYAAPLGYALILIGVLGQLAFSMYRTAGLWRGTHTVAATTPVIYLPTVAANFASASGLGALGHRDWAMLFFGMGLLSWFSVEAAILGRLRTEPALDPAVRGIIGVQLAPPFVGGNAYLAANGGHVDWVFLVLTGYGVLQLLFLLRLVPWILKAGYTMSLWGFSFGLGAMAGAGMHLVAVSQLVQLGWALWILGTALIAVLWLGMLMLAIRGRLLVR